MSRATVSLGQDQQYQEEDLLGTSFKFERPGNVMVGEILEIRSGTKYGSDKLMLRIQSEVDGKVYVVFPPTMAKLRAVARGAMMGDKARSDLWEWRKVKTERRINSWRSSSSGTAC